MLEIGRIVNDAMHTYFLYTLAELNWKLET